MAEARAREIHAEAKSGKEEFLALAARLSDDPDKKRNGGEMGYNAPTSFVAPLAARIASMKTKGEISEPVESHQGFHIVKFIDRKPAELRKFDEVKKAIIDEEKQRLAKQRHEELIIRIRSSPTATMHTEAVDALVVRTDDVLSRAAAAEAAKPAAEPPKPR
jgi:parvulin-like peptidyl-prolyl isomerase